MTASFPFHGASLSSYWRARAAVVYAFWSVAARAFVLSSGRVANTSRFAVSACVVPVTSAFLRFSCAACFCLSEVSSATAGPDATIRATPAARNGRRNMAGLHGGTTGTGEYTDRGGVHI